MDRTHNTLRRCRLWFGLWLLCYSLRVTVVASTAETLLANILSELQTQRSALLAIEDYTEWTHDALWSSDQPYTTVHSEIVGIANYLENLFWMSYGLDSQKNTFGEQGIAVYDHEGLSMQAAIWGSVSNVSDILGELYEDGVRQHEDSDPWMVDYDEDSRIDLQLLRIEDALHGVIDGLVELGDSVGGTPGGDFEGISESTVIDPNDMAHGDVTASTYTESDELELPEVADFTHDGTNIVTSIESSTADMGDLLVGPFQELLDVVYSAISSDIPLPDTWVLLPAETFDTGIFGKIPSQDISVDLHDPPFLDIGFYGSYVFRFFYWTCGLGLLVWAACSTLGIQFSTKVAS